MSGPEKKTVWRQWGQLRARSGRWGQGALQTTLKSLVFNQSVKGNYWEVSSGKMRRSFGYLEPWRSWRPDALGRCSRHLDTRSWTQSAFPTPDALIIVFANPLRRELITLEHNPFHCGIAWAEGAWSLRSVILKHFWSWDPFIPLKTEDPQRVSIHVDYI